MVDMLVSACRFCHPAGAVPLLLGVFFCLAALPAKSDSTAPDASAAGPFASAWTTQANGTAAMRLIALPPLDGRYEAAVEIKLAPSAITYWRDPGEAGVPPEFSFAGSENLGATEVLYPAPDRLDEGGLEAFGYRGGAVFPIRVTAADKAKPVRLALTLNYAVCDQICIPAKGHAELLLPAHGDSPLHATITAAEARVPVALAESDVAKEVAIRLDQGQAKPRWKIIWQGSTPASDLFVEGPEGWAFATRKTGQNEFSLAAVMMPSHPPATVPARFTLTGPARSYDFSLPLAVAAGH